MERPDENLKLFWTFAISKLMLSASDIGMTSPDIQVEGYFYLVKETVKGLERLVDTVQLTPHGTPVRFSLPPWLFGGKHPDELSPKEITEGFLKMLSNPIEVVPPPPSTVKWENIPPSKRERMKAAEIKKLRDRYSFPQPSGPVEDQQ
jgi:hypothetical protein